MFISTAGRGFESYLEAGESPTFGSSGVEHQPNKTNETSTRKTLDHLRDVYSIIKFYL